MVLEELAGLRWHAGALIISVGLLYACSRTMALDPEIPHEVEYRQIDTVVKWPLPLFGVAYIEDWERYHEEFIDWEYYREWEKEPPPEIDFEKELVVFARWPATFGPKPRFTRVLQSSDTLIVEGTMILPRTDCWKPAGEPEELRVGVAGPTFFILAVSRPDPDWTPDSVHLSVIKKQATECD